MILASARKERTILVSGHARRVVFHRRLHSSRCFGNRRAVFRSTSNGDLHLRQVAECHNDRLSNSLSYCNRADLLHVVYKSRVRRDACFGTRLIIFLNAVVLSVFSSPCLNNETRVVRSVGVPSCDVKVRVFTHLRRHLAM